MSVGHVQRAIESAGIPTVGVYVSAFGHVPAQMGVARALITPNPMGRPMGAPGDAERHLAVVRHALSLLEGNDTQNIDVFPEGYRTHPPTTA
ncbi:MAG: hypothetical protein O2925_04455 [Actinomycetota bacterium]|nr:hypothetical protein [Actinomycetota bacterium]MDA3015440.1 hypothetical protein [Actinomycetota bacterium]MDA3028030.1 hypothetical protein [Actinomycetota bacterium]